jgi:hypothetical protein
LGRVRDGGLGMGNRGVGRMVGVVRKRSDGVR